MSAYHIKTTGTRTTGASTAADWTDANCYPTVAATTDLYDLFRGSDRADGDEIILDDETHDIDRVLGNGITAGVTATLTVRSRSNVRANCILRFSRASLNFLNFNPPATALWSYVFRGMKITMTTPHTADATSPISMSTYAQDITFDNVLFSDIDMTKTSSGINKSALISDGAGSRTVTFNDCAWDNITGTNQAQSVLLCYASANTDVVFTGTNTIDGCAFENSNSGGTAIQSQAAGYFHLLGDVTMSGTFSGTNSTAQTANDEAACRSLLYVLGGPTKTLDAGGCDFMFDELTWTGEGAKAAGLLVDDTPYSLGDITHTNIDIVCATEEATHDSGIGAGVLITRSGAQGTIGDVYAENNSSLYGAGFYFSQGGGGVIESLEAINCSVLGGVFYNGGHGDSVVKSFKCIGTKEYVGNERTEYNDYLGVCYHSHMAPEVGLTTDGTRALYNYTFKDNYIGATNTDAPEMVIKNSLDTYTLDQTIGNGVHGEGTTQIEYTSTEAGATLNVVVNNCAYETSKVTGASVPDSLTESGHINETLTTNTDCSLSSDSDGIGAGVKWWGNNPRSHGANGEPYPDRQIDIGAYQSTHDEDHPANLAAVLAAVGESPLFGSDLEEPLFGSALESPTFGE